MPVGRMGGGAGGPQGVALVLARLRDTVYVDMSRVEELGVMGFGKLLLFHHSMQARQPRSELVVTNPASGDPDGFSDAVHGQGADVRWAGGILLRARVTEEGRGPSDFDGRFDRPGGPHPVARGNDHSPDGSGAHRRPGEGTQGPGGQTLRPGRNHTASPAHTRRPGPGCGEHHNGAISLTG